jgi:phosphatidylethanolamine/phosphatidyl-N-methylethanolamine N-methyltransferase
MRRATGDEAGQRFGTGAALFFKRGPAKPRQMGSVVPSQQALRVRIAGLAHRRSNGALLDVGAVMRALLEAEVPPERLLIVEIAPAMAEHLRDTYPGVYVPCGYSIDL